jgi:hypothetical protein
MTTTTVQPARSPRAASRQRHPDQTGQDHQERQCAMHWASFIAFTIHNQIVYDIWIAATM